MGCWTNMGMFSQNVTAEKRSGKQEKIDKIKEIPRAIKTPLRCRFQLAFENSNTCLNQAKWNEMNDDSFIIQFIIYLFSAFQVTRKKFCKVIQYTVYSTLMFCSVSFTHLRNRNKKERNRTKEMLVKRKVILLRLVDILSQRLSEEGVGENGNSVRSCLSRSVRKHFSLEHKRTT